jgi:hypothetical protein
MSAFAALPRFVRRLRNARSGVALIEFAYGLPIVLCIGAYGIEVANLALANLKVSQIAMALADNASRVGIVGGSDSIQQLRELDINDILQAVRLQGKGLDLLENGRITLSSLENRDDVQRIHWQRCIGKMSGPGWDSSYGTTEPTDGTDATSDTEGTPAPQGMGEPGAKVNAPKDSGVMFVEINYQYRPLMGRWLLGEPRIHYIASFVVRDDRDFTQLYNFAPAAERATCDKHTA